MFNRADKQALMTEEDYKRWQALEKSITIYRGVTPHNEKNVCALSWTLDAEKAEWFAMRFGENGKVYQAEIDIQAWLGHSDMSTTANIYSHLDDSDKLTSASVLGTILG